MSGRKLRREAKLAKCGLTSLSRCRTDKAGLDECKTCNLVSRMKDKWKMINKKPHRKCNRCGTFLPLEKFYPKKIRKPNGVVYESVECVCKMCRSEVEKEKYLERKLKWISQ